MANAEAIQIIKPVEHLFQLVAVDTLDKILEADDIKDRYIVVISIAGAYRKGKSFLLNFILKYLNAQYKRHDISNWVDIKMSGFKARGGRQPETTGIWIWSEIFSHDFDNGEKVAIILMDTQGIFDSRSTMKDNTVTFAISMMLSSVQCYNVMQNIQEDDLQHLQLFADYGRLAMQQHASNKPFQHLLFIIRDWPFAFENAYGNGQAVIDELLAETKQQTDENHQLRRQIKSTFEQIGAFLMPYPGIAIANGQFNGDINQISAEFINQLKILVPLLCAPENLVLKKIGGLKVRAREFKIFLKTYIEIFNSEKLPEPHSILIATATARCLLLFHECINVYMNTMKNFVDEKSLSEDKPYFTELELKEIHDQVKFQSLTKFQTTPKLGNVDVWNPFETRLITEIGQKYKHFQRENGVTQNRYDTKVKTDIREMYSNCLNLYIDSMQSALSVVDSFLSKTDLENAHSNARNNAITTFKNGKKRGWNELLFDSILIKLESDIQYNYLKFEHKNEKKQEFVQDLKNKSEEEIQRAKENARIEELKRRNEEAAAINKNMGLYGDCLNSYMGSMRRATIEKPSSHTPDELKSLHVKAKSESISKFDSGLIVGGDERMMKFRLESDIESGFTNFVQLNAMKRKSEEDAKERERMREHMEEMQKSLSNLKNQRSCGIL